MAYTPRFKMPSARNSLSNMKVSWAVELKKTNAQLIPRVQVNASTRTVLTQRCLIFGWSFRLIYWTHTAVSPLVPDIKMNVVDVSPVPNRISVDPPTQPLSLSLSLY